MMATNEINHLPCGHLLGRLLDAEGIALSIAEFLSAKDCLALQTTSRRWNDALSKHEKSLFDKHLRHDFPEGEVLSYVANKKNLSRKKLYRAFVGRWSLPKQGDETLRAAGSSSDRNTKIITTWTKSLTLSDDDYREEEKILVNDDVENVIFIASIEGSGGNNFSALMQWNSEFDDSNFDFDQSKFDQLIIDKSWSEESGIVPFLPDAGPMGEDCCELTLSLYAIDTRYYQVASMMENTTTDGSYYEDDRPQLNVFYGSTLPSLFGIPPKTSPYHNEVEERDFEEVIKNGLEGASVHCRLEYMTIAGRLRINVNENQWLRDYVVVNEDEDLEWDEHFEETYELDHPWKGVNFCFTGDGDRGYECSVDQPYKICSFLSTLMKERCIQIEHRPSMDIAMINEQPEWVQLDNIIDTITSFASHNDQVSKIRLVCRNFRLSALRQIQAKVFQNELIGFEQSVFYGETLFRATARRGWSDDFESKEGAIEDALWLASCRCRIGSCSCECLGEHISFNSSDRRSGQRETLSIAVETVRQRLAEKGSVCLDENYANEVSADRLANGEADNSVYCSYRDEETTLFDLFRKISFGIAYETDQGCFAELHDDLKRDYGVSNATYCNGFVRSILLPFATAMNKDHILDAGEGPREKKIRISPSSTNATIIEAKSNIVIENGFVSRKVGIYRFLSADNEPIEVRLDSYFSFDNSDRVGLFSMLRNIRVGSWRTEL
jgi:hypothetical protein